MIRTLLRAPRGPVLFADTARILATLSIAFAAIGDVRDALTVTVGALVTLLPRLLGVRPALDVAFSVVAPVAAWSAALDLYEAVLWWDLPIHFLLNGLLAALAHLLLVQVGVVATPEDLPRPALAAVVSTTSLGLGLGVLWELVEWFVHSFIDSDTFVGYVDSLGDLAAGGLGSVLAGVAMRFLAAGGVPAEDGARSRRA